MTLCDSQLPEGWYRFVGDAGTKMQTKSVPRGRCGTINSGWLTTAHPSVEDGNYIMYTNFLRLKIVQSASAGQTKSEA